MYIKIFQNAQHCYIDFIGIDNVCCFVIYSKVGQIFQREVSVMGMLICVVNMVVQCYYYIDGVFSNGFWIIGWNMDYFQFQFFCCVKVDVIEIGIVQGDIFNVVFFQFFQYWVVVVIVYENIYCFVVIGSFSGFFCQQKVKKFQFKVKGFVYLLQVFFVVLFCVINGEFYKIFFSDVELYLSY